MDRIREGRRGNLSSVNGGLSRRRQRSSILRDSPEEDGQTEMQETGRPRDRGIKKDRDYDRSSHSKRRRGERMVHGDHPEERDDSLEDSDEEENEGVEEDAVATVLLPPLLLSNSATPDFAAQGHHLRRGLAAKSARSPGMGTWKVAEDMIGAPIPRKARSGGGGGGRRDAAHGKASTYLASPPSSNPTQVRNKKSISATINLHPKSSTPTSSIQDIEIEVAEVLFEMTRQAVLKQENENNASTEFIGLSTEGKPMVSSPNGITFASSISMPSNPNSNSDLLSTAEPKRPRMRFAEESLTCPPSSGFLPDAASPLSAKNVESPAFANLVRSSDLAVCQNCSFFATPAVAQADSVKPEDNPTLHLKESEIWPDMKAKEEESYPQKGSGCANLSIDIDEGIPASKTAPVSENPKEEKFNIDLIVGDSSVGKSSMVVENTSDDVTDRKYVELETVHKFEVFEGEGEKMNKSMNEPAVIPLVDMHEKELWTVDGDWKERSFEEGKHGHENSKNVSFASKDLAQKQQCRAPRTESKADTSGMMASFPSQMRFNGWPAGLPLHTLGYVGQVPPLPPVVPLNGNSSSSKIMQSFLTSQLRPKRCASHCYLAYTIHYHQQMTRLNPFWSSTAGAVPFYVSKQCNINSVPLSGSAVVGGSLQGSRCLASVQEKGGCGLPIKDIDNADRLFVDGPQRKQPILQQSSQSASNDMFAPAFVFPLNQAQAAGAGPVNRSGVPKLLQATGNSAQSSAGSSSTAMVVSPTVGMGTSMGFSYGVFPPSDAQYPAFLQNNGYPLPIPAHINGASPYRGPSTAQSLPFFGYSIYSSQMLSPPQFELSLPQQQAHTSRQGLHHPSTSSGSSSSKKNTQQSMMVPAIGFNTFTTGSSHGFPTCMQQNLLYQTRQLESETGGEDAPSTADSTVLQTQNNYAKIIAIAPQLQNFPLTSPLIASFSSDGGSKAEKQQQTQNQLIKVDPPASKPFAMSFASLGGTDAALVGVAPAGLDFSSVARNCALFQSLPTAAIMTQHKQQLLQGQMNKKSEDGKSGANLGKASAISIDDEKISVTKCLGNVQSNSLTFSMAESELPISSVLSSSIVESSSQALSFIWPNNGTHVSTQIVSSAPPSESAASTSFPSNSHRVLMQKQHQQLQVQEERGKLASSNSITSMYNDHLPGSSTATKFPQVLTGFPPTLIQSSGSTPTPQWKPSSKATAPLPATPTPSASSAKNQIPLQQQVRSNQLPSHKTQISFGVNLAKASTVITGNKNGASLSSIATIVADSAMNSVSKTSVGSPLSSIVASSGAAPSPEQPIEKQQIGKCLSSSSSAISPLPVISSTTKLQPSQHLQQQQLTKQHFSQAPILFAHPYVQNETSHSDAAVVNSGYFQQHQQQRPPDHWQFQQKQQQNLSPGWTGMLSLGPSSSLSLAGGSSTAVNTSKPAGNRAK
ncbi:hypothetical protein HPP92_024870 [Vanilla planifolia]|uniref:Protein TIME FOR COFFEE-like n=1 Tax=Vanilla planifolia TaxID=51239 RepID=A0A835PMS1_VANPL|nr:hypothetical protein HPP92_024870 [Vanilla planifolia]